MDDLEKQLTEKVNSIEELFRVKIDPLKERIEHVEKNNTETKTGKNLQPLSRSHEVPKAY